MITKRLSPLTALLTGSVVLASVLLVQATGRPTTPDNQSGDESQRASRQKVSDEQSDKATLTGGEWFGRAYTLHSASRYPEAIEAFKRAIDLGYRQATSMYNIACGYSLLNDKENALAWLRRAVDTGFDRADLLAEDSDLDPLRSDSRFRELVASAPNAEKIDKYSSKKQDRLERATLDFTRLERAGSRDGDEWAGVGLQLLLLRDLDRSVIALNRAVTHFDYKAGTAMYNLACAYALKGDREAGIQWLAKSVNSGFDNPDKVQNDPDLNSLRADPRFARIEKDSRVLSLSQFYKGFSDDGRYPKQQWLPAVALYRPLVEAEPNNGRAWFNLGFALHYSGEHARAIEAFECARQLGYNRPIALYNIACAYSMLGQRDLAFDWLERAFAEGYDPKGYISGDRDLDNLRSDPRFKRFVSMARERKDAERNDER